MATTLTSSVAEPQRAPTALRQLLLYYFALPLAFPLFINQGISFKWDYYAFEPNDDANHTFVNLHVFRTVARDGSLPQMNVYNNFGTPLAGDSISCPYAPHSLTYWLLPDYLAMTVNRFVLCFVTLQLLTYYYHSSFSLVTASTCALLTFQTPSFFWHFAHHHYQITLLLFAFLLIAQQRLLVQPRLRYVLFLYLGLVFTFLSTNLNVALLMAGLLLANHVLLQPRHWLRRALEIAGLILAGIIFSYPEHVAMLDQVDESMRLGTVYGSPHTPAQLLQSLAVQNYHQVEYWSTDLYFSLPILGVVLASMVHALSHRARRPEGLRLLLLGVVPLLVVTFLITNPKVFGAIPLLRSTDITRVWWFSNVFLIAAVGRWLEDVRWGKLSLRAVIGQLCGAAALLGGYVLVLEFGNFPFGYQLPAYVFLGLLVAYAAARLRKTRSLVQPPQHLSFQSCFAIALLLAMAVSTIRILYSPMAWHGGTHFMAPKAQADFQPTALLPLMKPYSRLASDLFSGAGMDLRCAEHRLFGSNGRDVLLNREFAEYLQAKDAITIDRAPPLYRRRRPRDTVRGAPEPRSSGYPPAYHFRQPVDTELLARLGIKYFLVAGWLSEDLERKRWKFRGSAVLDGHPFLRRWEVISLYENPLDVSIVYQVAAGRRVPVREENLRVQGNGLVIDLAGTAAEGELVVTLLALPHWEATVDGVERDITKGEDCLIRIPISPSDQKVELIYEKYTAVEVTFGILLSLGMLTGVCMMRRWFSTCVSARVPSADLSPGKS